MPLEPRASWFSPKCVEAQQLTGHLGVKHSFGAGRESGTKSSQTLNTRYDLKITGVKVGSLCQIRIEKKKSVSLESLFAGKPALNKFFRKISPTKLFLLQHRMKRTIYRMGRISCDIRLDP